MPTFAPHIRVSFGGTSRSPFSSGVEEIWNCTVNCIPTPGGTFDESGYLNGMHASLAAWFESATTYMSNLSNLTYVKCNRINAAGHYADPTGVFFYDYPEAHPGSQAPIDPPIITTAYTWTTALKRGPGSHGRVYPPNNGLGPAGSQHINDLALPNMVAAAKQLLDAIAHTPTVGPAQLIPVVASGVNATNTPITGVSIGNIKDVQRKRKDALKESYTRATWS